MAAQSLLATLYQWVSYLYISVLETERIKLVQSMVFMMMMMMTFEFTDIGTL